MFDHLSMGKIVVESESGLEPTDLFAYQAKRSNQLSYSPNMKVSLL